MATLRKREKARARRKDYEKKINIHRQNKPVERYEEEVDIVHPVREANGSIKMKKGVAQYHKVGTKTIVRKRARTRLLAGDGVLPKSRKYRLGKKQQAVQKEANKNVLNQTATGN